MQDLRHNSVAFRLWLMPAAVAQADGSAENGLRTDADFLQNRRHDAFFIFQQRRQQMNISQKASVAS